MYRNMGEICWEKSYVFRVPSTVCFPDWFIQKIRCKKPMICIQRSAHWYLRRQFLSQGRRRMRRIITDIAATEEGTTCHFMGTEWRGRGSYGVVWAACNSDGDQVAIKKMSDVNQNEIMAKRALREIKLLRLLKHKNIIDLYQVHLTEDGRDLYLVTDLMDCDLGTIIESPQPLLPDHSRFFVYQILCGLLYMHSSNVVHRDLKPANLVVNKDCTLKICDFGLARVDFTDFSRTVCMTGDVTSRWYRAPEVMLGWDRYSKAVDMWAVGCIAAELVLREPLFKSKSTVEHIQAVLSFLGPPPKSALPHITDEYVRAYVENFPSPENPVPLASLFPAELAGPDFVDFISRLLCVDPSQRLTVQEALRHPYLSALHYEPDEPVADCPIQADDARFAFEAQNHLRSEDFINMIRCEEERGTEEH